MSAGFYLSSDRTLKCNIKYMYSGNPAPTKFRTGKEYPNMAQLSRAHSNKELKQYVLYVRAIPEEHRYHGITHVSKAPAFNDLEPDELEESVRRLRKLTISSKGNRDRCKHLKDDNLTPRYSGRKMTAEEQRALVERLSSPTHMSRMRAEKDIHRTMTDINGRIAPPSANSSSDRKRCSSTGSTGTR